MERYVTLPGGEKVAALGQGTWFMGERRDRHADEVAAIRLGVELGMTLVDTAEMYGDGGAELMLGEALDGIRDEVFLVSKVYPQNAGFKGVQAACERSLKRMKTDRIDLYLLHWRGGTPFEETVRGFEALQEDGKIRNWGVSNMDTDDMEELLEAQGGENCTVNQILYNLTRRGPEYDLLPFQQKTEIPIMAYSPIEQGRLPRTGALAEIGAKHGVDPFTIALAWLLRRPDVIAIPKATNPDHVRTNRAAADIVLDAEDLAALDKAFPPPTRKRPLEML
ncbi:aldo/keto reductase [Terrihabitans rhizophilus]|uniref:Aldo/keto reductase n=1 Tax=Terrihabitans rhizophilus TaxID=3092662 RepID=A0ABU4RQW0_9HYPH|nr:aldo/keto reductase [Terrihabitans sp. PJ23]MDX6806025.1 aldo/keto reductase [Terrihabitans sp. PJ23]